MTALVLVLLLATPDEPVRELPRPTGGRLRDLRRVARHRRAPLGEAGQGRGPPRRSGQGEIRPPEGALREGSGRAARSEPRRRAEGRVDRTGNPAPLERGLEATIAYFRMKGF